MTAETLHDALTLLPADLVAAADKKRNRKPIRVHWQRWTAMAACLAVILSFGLLLRGRLLGGAKSTAAEFTLQEAMDNCAPEEAAAAEVPIAGATAGNGSPPAAAPRSESQLQDSAAAEDHGIWYVNTPDTLNTTDIHGPEVSLIASQEALEAYRDEWGNDYLLDELMTACKGYDDVWFQSHDLVLIPVYPVAADGGVTVTEVIEAEAGLEVHIAVSPSNETDEYTTWHILLETEKGLVPTADAVTLRFE